MKLLKISKDSKDIPFRQKIKRPKDRALENLKSEKIKR
jgi:hypothetical protein